MYSIDSGQYSFQILWKSSDTLKHPSPTGLYFLKNAPESWTIVHLEHQVAIQFMINE